MSFVVCFILSFIFSMFLRTQKYSTKKANWPVGEPVTKIEGLIQCSGEAEYVNDIPKQQNELYGALVLTDRATSTILTINASAALSHPGVKGFFSAKDIPGVNTFINVNNYNLEDEELFCSGQVLYAGQPVGIIVADNQKLAIQAAKAVLIEYGVSRRPQLTVKDVLQIGDKKRVRLLTSITPTHQGSNVAYKVQGEYAMEGQFHFTMELQSSLCVPTDVGMDVYCSTQWMRNNQGAIARALNISQNDVNIHVKRLGGGFGSRITKSAIVSTACAVAAHKLNRPVRMTVSMETNFRAMGQRYSNLAKYDAGVDKKGKIQYLNIDFYENFGVSINDNIIASAVDGIRNCYDSSTFRVSFFAVFTDMPSSTWMRAPGSIEGISTIETIIEHIAHVVGLDPQDVRTVNLLKADEAAINEIRTAVINSSGYNDRLQLIQKENQINRWKKRGISLIPMKFGLRFENTVYSTVSIYCDDGTVAVTTGGIEMGQGVNTKVVQVCALALGIDMKMIKVKPNMTITAPNNFVSGGSITTDTTCFATMRACEILVKRLEPTRAKMKNPTWPQLVKQANLDGIDLKASYMYSTKEPAPNNYPIYGATVLEVEVDVLTGQYQIQRVDILEDCGESLSPLLDVGQVEGAFVMGLGYFHSEQPKYEKMTGRLLTDRTWTYWPPGAKDIPIDFRIEFRKNSPNPLGVQRSKATGEPPLCMTPSLQHALRQALRSARLDAGLKDDWFQVEQPCTFERTLLAAGTSKEQFMF